VTTIFLRLEENDSANQGAKINARPFIPAGWRAANDPGSGNDRLAKTRKDACGMRNIGQWI